MFNEIVYNEKLLYYFVIMLIKIIYQNHFKNLLLNIILIILNHYQSFNLN